MHQNNLFKTENEINPTNFGEALQQAIEIEIATIPVYLYTYYSINRSPNQDAISGSIAQALVRKGTPVGEANATALNLSADIMVFANKAGALIMSVAIEEMLHMALSSNVKQALVGHPDLTGKSPSVWPTCLPGHVPEFEINKAPLSLDQLMTFLKIESPKPLPEKQLLGAIPYRTIGEFYKMIKEYITGNDLVYHDRPQLVPGRGYYAQNNIDTTYYDKEHKAHLVNNPDSGDLITVHDRNSALMAIDIIVEQGEGNEDAPGLTDKGGVDCTLYPSDYDYPDFKELSHFEKFARIYCRYEYLNHQFDKLGIGVDDIGIYFVNKIATNPVTADYPANIQAMSNLLNAVYTYIFVMTEGCYKKDGHTQYEIFMFGIHKSMIFILNSLCGQIMGMSYTDKKDGKTTYMAAPTFEDYPFGLVSSPKQQVIATYNAAIAAGIDVSYLGQRIQDLPDVAL